MILYLVTFLACLASDSLPIIGPPVWTIMAFMVAKFDLNPWAVLWIGETASVLGRYGLSLYSKQFAGRFITKAKSTEMEFLGRKLNGSLWKTWMFVLLYSLLPLSTTALFFTVGLAKIKPLRVLPPFFVGKMISNAVMLFGSSFAIHQATQPGFSLLSWKSLLVIFSSVIVIAVFLFLDWRRLLSQKKLHFNFHIWR